MTLHSLTDARATPTSARAPELPDAHTLLDQLPGGVVLLDAAGTVLYLNRIAELRLDCSRAEALGRDLFRDLVPHLEREGLGERYRTHMAQGGVTLAWEGSLPSPAPGAYRAGLGIRSCVRGNQLWGVLLMEDRSALAEEQARRRHAERLAAIGDLAGGVAHEINNPLASIKGFAQLLAEDAATPEQAQALSIIGDESVRIARIIDRLLSFIQRQERTEAAVVNLSALTAEALALKVYALETAGVEIEQDLDPTLSPVHVAEAPVQRALLAVLARAEAALNQVDGERRLTLRTRESSDGVVLYVIDNGPGIERRQLARVLSTADEGEAGLGLRYAAEMVREQGGQIWVDSIEGQGTSVVVRFARYEADSAAEAAVSTPPPEPTRRAPDAPLRILVADDESTLRLALGLFLRRFGHEVVEAADAHEALRLAQEREFDVALVDVRMPGDGLVLLEKLEAMPHLRGRTVLMTGDSTQARVRDRMRPGLPHLTKPFDMVEAVRLLEVIARDPDSLTSAG